MKYKCPKCGCTENPKIISFFPPEIVRCVKCGEKFHKKEFIEQDDSHFSPIPKM